MKKVDRRFGKGYEAIERLSDYPRYQAAFIFGSVAEGTSTASSDLDARVVVDEDNPCNNVNHPTFDDYKLDISFRSFKQIRTETENDIEKGERPPVLARSIIVFDKTGQLTDLQKMANKVMPKKFMKKDHLFTQFMIYHANEKVERYLEDDPVSALYSMHANIGDVLKKYYMLKGRWWVSSKKILNDLEAWDGHLAGLLKKFVVSGNVREKY